MIATGAQAKWLGLDSEEALKGKGVSACATCDGFFYRGKKVAVIGGGNTAVEEALYLTNHSPDVTLIHRRDSLARREDPAGPAVRQRQDHRGVEQGSATASSTAAAPPGWSRSTCEDTVTGEHSRLDVEGGFVAIGHHPATELFRGHLELDADHYIKVESGSTRTSVPGVFACGDVMDKVYRQAVTAAGTGCMAALDAERFLAEADFEKAGRDRRLRRQVHSRIDRLESTPRRPGGRSCARRCRSGGSARSLGWRPRVAKACAVASCRARTMVTGGWSPRARRAMSPARSAPSSRGLFDICDSPLKAYRC